MKELKKTLIEKATQQIVGQNSRSRSVSNLNGETKLIDWRRLLENNCKFDKDWSYQNATIEYGVLTPHMEDLPMPETEIILDTSGSINEQLLRNFLRECLGILHQSKVRVGCFDDVFYGFTNIRTKKDIENLSLIGGGGTNFEIAVKAFSKDADNKIIFTDGLANMPKTKVNAIWVVFGNDSISPPGGKVISIREEELRKLNMIDKRGNIGKHR